MRRIFSVAVLSLLAGFASAAEFRLNLKHERGIATVELSGDTGKQYLIETATGSADKWSPITSFILTDPSRLWKDATATTGNRFFRARTIPADEEYYANNFRLIDQNGVAKELYYYHSLASLKAIVLIFADGNYSTFASKIAALKTSYPNNVFFWTIETGADKTRATIAAQATAAGITWPVFYDPMQLVTRDLDTHFTGEVIVLSRDDMRIVYRGVIDDGGNNYLSAALANIVSGSALTTTRLESAQNPIARPARAVADYSTVIAPLLQAKCVTCHSPGNIGVFEMTGYQSIVEHADIIKEEVMERNMPPWHADPDYGRFHNDISLTRSEMAQLIDWINAGLPRGTGPDPITAIPPPASKWPKELGEPDQIVKIPIQQVPASGVLAYRYIYANATNPTDKWLRAAVVRPGNPRVVHHYIVWQGHSQFAQLSGVAAYAPGRTERGFPEGTGILLPANCDLTFNLHYTADGEDETDEPELALWYASTPPAKALQTAAVLNFEFTFLKSISIPAGDPDFQITASQTFNTPIRLYSFSPHMHFRGSRMRFELTVPGVAGKQILLSVPHYDFDWQTIYTLEQPLDLPANSRIDVIGAFDNSAQNVYNPDPKLAIKWGEQSWDEMFIGYLEYSER